MNLANLPSNITFILGRDVFRIPVSILIRNGIDIALLYKDADTLVPEWIYLLPDANKYAFERIIKFLCKPSYKQAPFENVDELLSIIRIGEICPPLKSICLSFVRYHMSSSVALGLLTSSSLNVNKNVLIEIATAYIVFRPSNALETKEIIELPSDLLHRCLEHETVRNQPSRVFEMLTKKALKEYQNTQKHPRKMVKEFLSKVDFLDMNMKDFLSGPANSVVLTDWEKISIMDNLEDPGSTQLPSWCSTRRKRKLQQMFCLDFCGSKGTNSEIVKSPFMSVAHFSPENRDVILLGLELHCHLALDTSSYLLAEVKVNIDQRSMKTNIPFLPQTSLLQLPTLTVIKRGATCHLTVTVVNEGVQLKGCGQNKVIEAKTKTAQVIFNHSCNLTKGSAHIKKIYLQKYSPTK